MAGKKRKRNGKTSSGYRKQRAIEGKRIKSRRYGGGLIENTLLLDESYRKLMTFEEEYKTFRVTRGKRGVISDPDKRGPENPQNDLFKCYATYCGKFPIGELMSKPIRKEE